MTRNLTLLAFGAVLLVTGCSTEEFDDLQDFVNNSGKDLRGKLEPPPEVKPYEPFNYKNPDGLPDPFVARKPEAPPGTDKAKKNGGPPPHPKEELEDYPLESLKMVGYIYIRNTANAVIKSPDGKTHHVKVGNYMGQNFGKILSITETEVKLNEQVQDSSTGNWTERVSTLQLLE